METEKIIQNLNIIKRIFVEQIKIGIKAESFIYDFFKFDRFKFEDEISQNNSKEIVSLCNEISELYKQLPSKQDDLLYYYTMQADFSETFVLTKRIDRSWMVQDGTLNSNWSDENNKRQINTGLISMKFDESLILANLNLISFSNGILELCNKQPQPESELLTTTVEKTRLISIHKFLLDNKYIDVDVDSWLYWFSKQTWIKKNKKPSFIKWIKAPYHLTNVVYLICGNMEVQTETAMKKAFKLPSGSNFQKVTKNNIKGEFYKDIENILNWAERFLQ